MNKRVLFTHSYFLYLDEKQLKAGNAYPPLGTMYAAALLRENGYAVSLFDSMLSNSPLEIRKEINLHKPDFLVIYDDGFNYLTKMCLSNMRHAAFTMIRLAMEYNCKIIICNSDSTDHYEKYLEAGADFVILGEGELTLLELINKLSENKDTDDIPGITYKEATAIINKGKRPVNKDLDTLPLPAWDLVDVQKYKQLWYKNFKYFSLNIVTTRGCTYKCNWCAKPIFGNRYNARTPAMVIEELKILVERFGADHIWVCDDIFGLKPGWIQEFAHLIEQSGLHFKFKIQSRADLLMDEDTIKNLAKAGCETVWLGAESGSQKILDAMEKGITLKQIYDSRNLLRKHDIKTAFFLQFGYPDEQEDDIQATIKMILDLLPDDIGISITYPLPGTKLFENVKLQLKEKANWTDSDELAMMFENTYPKAYYKELQKYVHQTYRFHKGWELLSNTMYADLSFKTAKMTMKIPYNYTLSLVLKYRLRHLKNKKQFLNNSFT